MADFFWPVLSGGGGGSSPLTTKGDVYTHNATVDARLPVGADGLFLKADSTQATGLIWAVSSSVATTYPLWSKYTITHTALQAAALTNDIQVFSLVAKGVIHSMFVQHTTMFAGTGITDYKVSVGITGNFTKFSTPFDVDVATGGAVGQMSLPNALENTGSATSIRIQAVSVGANLDQSTAGSVDVYVLTATLP